MNREWRWFFLYFGGALGIISAIIAIALFNVNSIIVGAIIGLAFGYMFSQIGYQIGRRVDGL